MRYCREKNSRGSKEQEAVILKAGGDYVIRYMKERSINEWPEAEPLFKTDPKIAIWYAMRQGKPYPEGEDAIARTPRPPSSTPLRCSRAGSKRERRPFRPSPVSGLLTRVSSELKS